MGGDVKNDKKTSFKQKEKENIGWLSKRRGELAANDADEAEVLNAFFTSVFTRTAVPQVQVDAKPDPPAAKEELEWDLLEELDPSKSMGLDVLHPRVFSELADVVARPLSVIFERAWRCGEVPEDRKNQ